MFLKIKLIASIIDNKGLKSKTLYFFHKDSQTLLPANISLNNTGTFANTYIRTLNAFSIKVEKILIYFFNGNYYQVYLSLRDRHSCFEINTDLETGYCINKNINCPVYIKKELLEENGIRINREMLIKYMSKDLIE